MQMPWVGFCSSTDFSPPLTPARFEIAAFRSRFIMDGHISILHFVGKEKLAHGDTVWMKFASVCVDVTVHLTDGGVIGRETGGHRRDYVPGLARLHPMICLNDMTIWRRLIVCVNVPCRQFLIMLQRRWPAANNTKRSYQKNWTITRVHSRHNAMIAKRIVLCLESFVKLSFCRCVVPIT